MNLHTSHLQKFKQKPFKFKRDIQCLVEENQELASLRDWLLPMLMNGQVTVAEALATKGMETKVGEYEEKGGVRVAAEGMEKYNQKQ